ncbi:secreted ookinete protein, putative [Plasmodium sp. gorilla clade G1]|nr:secreted ookinete protein, putative [Plasmodium sp. gorilla clade G1]
MKFYSTFVICFIILKVCLSKNINLNDEGKKKQSGIINENEEGKNNKSNNNKKVQHNKINRKGNNSVTKKTDEHKNDGDGENKKNGEHKKNDDVKNKKNGEHKKNDDGKNKKMDEHLYDIDGENKKTDEHLYDVDGENKKTDEHLYDIDGGKNNILEYNNIDQHNEFPESLENDNSYDKLFDDVELRDIIHNEKFFENLKNVNNNDVHNFLLVDKEMERRKEEEKKKSRKLEEDEEDDEDEEEDNDEKWKEENKNNSSSSSSSSNNNNFNKNYDIYDNRDLYNDDNLVDITQEEHINVPNINDEINEGRKHDKEDFLIFEKRLNEAEDRNDSSDGDNKMEDLINNHFDDSGDNGSYENIQVKKELYNKNEKIIKGRDNNLNDGDIHMNKNNTSNKLNNNNNMNSEMKYKTFKEEYEEQILSKPESIKYFFEVITEILIVIRLGLIYRYTNFLIPFKNFLISKTLENVEMVCVTFLSIHKFGREKYPDIYGFFLIILILYILKYVFKKMMYKLYYNKYGMGKKYSLRNQESENMYMQNLLKRILYNVEKKKVLSNYESILQDILENTDNLLVNSNIINKENKNIYTDMISNINNIGVFTYISTQALKKINHKSDLIINELTTNGFIDEDTSNKMDKLKNFASINEYPYVDIKKFKDNLVNEYDEHFILNDKMRYSGFHSMENDKSPPNDKYNMDSYNMDSYNMENMNMDNMNMENMNMDNSNMDNMNMDNSNMDNSHMDNSNMDNSHVDMNNMNNNNMNNNNMGVHINMNNNYLSNKYKHNSAYDENNVQDFLQKSKKQDYGHVTNTLKDGKQMIYNNMDPNNKKDDNYFKKMMRDSDLSNYNGRKSMYLNESLEDDMKNNDYDNKINNKNFDYANNNSTYIVEGKEIQQGEKNKTNDMNKKKKDESFIHYDNKKIINNLNPFSPLNDYNNISNNKKNTINEEQNNNINESDVITYIANSYINKPPSNINRFSQTSIYNTHNKVTNPLLNTQRNVPKEVTQRKNTEASVNNNVEENYLRNKVTNHDTEQSVENKLDEDKLKMSTHMVNNIFEGTKEYIKTNEDMNNISKAGDPFLHNQEGSFSYAPPPYQGVENSSNKNQKYLTQRKERQQIVATKSPFN